MDGWKTTFLLGPGLFSGAFAVSFREGIYLYLHTVYLVFHSYTTITLWNSLYLRSEFHGSIFLEWIWVSHERKFGKFKSGGVIFTRSEVGRAAVCLWFWSDIRIISACYRQLLHRTNAANPDLLSFLRSLDEAVRECWRSSTSMQRKQPSSKSLMVLQRWLLAVCLWWRMKVQ